MTLKISVPLHITGFFSPHFSDNPLLAGSVGAGLVISPGLNCVCKFSNKKTPAKNEVIYNGVKAKIKPVDKLFKLTNFNEGVSFKISSSVPLGFGYGASGASTLAASLIIHKILGKSELKAARTAHIAEAKSLTGLGDVAALFEGKGLTARIKAGAPGIGKIKNFPQSKKIRIVAADLRKIETKKMLKSMAPETAEFSSKILEKFIKNPDLKNFFDYSRLFAEKMKFADKKFFEKMEPLKQLCIGFSVKKGVLFAAIEQSKVKNAVSILKKISPVVHIFKLGGGIT